MKRNIDVIISITLLILLFPLILILAVVIRVSLGSPIIFCQNRPGFKERIFKMYKYRSMTEERDANGKLLPGKERLTRFGKFMRSTSLDELPELINVIKGDMSLVGPRPLRVEYLEYYSDEQKKRHDVKPGITGWAQVHGRNSVDWDEKLLMDLWYVNNHSVRLDLRILFMTIVKVLRREGINDGDGSLVKPFKGARIHG